MPNPFRTSRRVEFVDTDMAGIMHFSNFFRFMEAAEQELLRTLGLGVTMTWEGQKVGLPRVAASCAYVNPARFEDVLEIAVSVARVGTKSVTYTFEFTCRGDQVARGELSAVFCRMHPGHMESLEIPGFVRDRLETIRVDSTEAPG